MLREILSLALVDILFLLVLLTAHFILFYRSSLYTLYRSNFVLFIAAILLYTCLIILLLLNLGVVWDLVRGSENNTFKVIVENSVFVFIANTCKLSSSGLHMFGFTLVSMLLIFIISIYYTVAFSKEDLLMFCIYTIVIYIGGILMLTSTSILVVFIGYELILLPTIYIIDKFSKTSRGREACDFMIVWTQIGAFLLFGTFGMLFWGTPVFVHNFSSYNMSNSLTNLLVILIFIGFGAKMPVYPFYS